MWCLNRLVEGIAGVLEIHGGLFHGPYLQACPPNPDDEDARRGFLTAGKN